MNRHTSFCMLVKNGKHSLPACLKSLRPLQDLIQEWVFLDTGSDDGTQAYLQQALPDARILETPWPGHFGQVRNQLLKAVRGPWVLMLDADESVAPESLPALRAVLSQPPEATEMMLFLREDRDAQQQVFHWTLLPRLFVWQPALHFVGAIHERPALTTGQLVPPLLRPDIRILHFSQRRLPPAKEARYRQLLAWARQYEPSPLMDFYWFTLPGNVTHLQPALRLKALEDTLTASLAGPPPGQSPPLWVKAPLAELILEIQRLLLALQNPAQILACWPRWQQLAVLHAESWVIYGQCLEHSGRVQAAETAYLNALDPYYSAADPSQGWDSWRPLQRLAQLARQQNQLLQADSYAWQAKQSSSNVSISVPEQPLEVLLPALQQQIAQAVQQNRPWDVLPWAAAYLPHHLSQEVLLSAWQAAAELQHELGPLLAALLQLLWPTTSRQLALRPVEQPGRSGEGTNARLQQALLPAQFTPRRWLQWLERAEHERLTSPEFVGFEAIQTLAPQTSGWLLQVLEAPAEWPESLLQQVQTLSCLPPSRWDIFVWQQAGLHLRLLSAQLEPTQGLEVRLT